MKKIEKISETQNYTAVNIGKLDELVDYIIPSSNGGPAFKGKVFVKDAIKSTGSEMSYSTIPPKKGSPYFHTHNKNEELYIILKGSGYFQVDNDYFPISEGSLIRVAPAGKRGMYNSSDEVMIYLCVQTKENSLEEYGKADGNLAENEAKWK
ncbi:MAG: cupin domain-containing protein [Fusobacteriaceae bacterium]|jgi:mannose-6-phosphate isomerase-like protein (cupin superfamily)|nr:cupin domain-containing protein [Fusobacteriaceae bacterium]